MGKYDDIINLPHHVSPTRPKMSMVDRAAQFAPFAALTGFGDQIIETGRYTEEKIELDETAIAAINERLRIISEHIAEKPPISVTYFVPDRKKHGGTYVEKTLIAKKLDTLEGVLVADDGDKIPFDDIYSIESELFSHFWE